VDEEKIIAWHEISKIFLSSFCRCCSLLLWVITTVTYSRFQMTVKKKINVIKSDQSQQEQTAWWTNQNSYLTPVTCSQRGKNGAYKVRLVLVFLLTGWKNWHKILKLSIVIAIVELVWTVICKLLYIVIEHFDIILKLSVCWISLMDNYFPRAVPGI